jgi:subtilisin family serine protease
MPGALVTHASRARLGGRAIVAVTAALLLPLGIGTASAAAPAAKPAPRPASHVPANLHTAGSLHAPGALPTQGRVSVMLELDARPAAAAYSSALHLGLPTARTASRSAAKAVERQQRSVESSFSHSATRATTLFRVHALYSGVAVVTDASHLPALAHLPGVKAIHLLTPKKATNANTVPLTGAPQAWETGASGTGPGVTIGIIDTGIDYTHADFGGPGTVGAYNTALAHSADAATYPDTAKVAGGYDFAGDTYNADPTSPDFQPLPHPDTNPLDCQGHGSHVAGTAAGYGVNANGTTFHGPYTTSTPFSSLKIGPGMAPGATLYALKVFGCTGATDVVSAALDWAADPNGDGDVSDHLDVVNMSLGVDFSSPEDPDAVATNNAALAGITVAAAMGNAGDAFEVGGSPGSASRAIAVAASDDNTDLVDGVGVKFDGTDAPGTPFAGELSAAYDWTNKPGVTDAPLAEIATTWSDGTAATLNSDGCDALTTAEKAKVTGKVALLYWTDNDVNRRCGSATRSANVKAAGAIGALFGDDSNRFAAGITGDPNIPVVITTSDARDAIKGALEAVAPKAVTVTLTGALRLAVKSVLTGGQDPTDQIVGFSSRGISQSNNVKPDVSAPGNTIVSVGMGTGSAGVVDSGTSMAAPHVAGEAALVVAAHPDWRPEQVKAAIMNTSTHHVFPLPAHGGAALGVLRAGAGRIDAQAAVDTDSLAYVVDDPGEVSVSFGTLDVTTPTLTRTKQVRVENDSSGSKTYALTVEDVDTLPGAAFAVSPTSVTLAAHTSREVTVTLSVTQAALTHKPDPSLDLDPLGQGGQLDRDWASYASARLVVTPTSGDVLDVPLYAAPRPASTMHAAGTPTMSTGTSSGAGNLILAGNDVSQGTGDSAEQSTVSAFELQASSPKLPACGSAGSLSLIIGCIPYEDTRSADLRYVGVASDAVAVRAAGEDPFKDPASFGMADVPSFVYFGISTWGPWRTPQGLQEYDVFIDTNGDGLPDLETFNDRVTTSNGAPVDVFLATTVSLRDGDGFATVDEELLNDAPGQFDTRKIGSDSLVLPVELNLLAHPDGVDENGKKLRPFLSAKSPRFQYTVESYNGEIGLTDVAGEDSLASLLDPSAPPVVPFSFDPTKPGLMATSGGEPVLAIDSAGVTLGVKLNRSTVGLDGGLGLLLIHHLNANGARAEVVGISKDASTTTLALSPTSAGYWAPKFATATVAITGNPTKPNGGSVLFKDGSKVIATGSLVSGKATVRLPYLTIGKHHITAAYVASVSLGGSTSSSKPLTVKRSASSAKLSVSPTKVSHVKHARATVTVTVPGSGRHPTGTVKVYAGSKVIATGSLRGGKVTLTLPKFAKGSHALKAVYSGDSTVAGDTSPTVKITSN